MIVKFVLSLFCLGMISLATTTTASAQAVNVDKAGVALEGYDPVAFFTDKKAVKGNPANKATADGATYYFASAEHLAAFQAEPKKYEPVFGGFCAYGVANGKKVKVEIDTWQIVDGKLYLNYDQSVKKDFNKDAKGYISKANSNWPTVATKKLSGWSLF